jgi:3-deoxy-D-manno-octulosonic-acid transferase
MIYWFYNFFLTLFLVFLLPFLPLLFVLGGRFREGFLQRVGFYPREAWERLRGSRPIWMHAVSVGEVLSAGNLAEQLKKKFPERKILLSTFTSTGSEIARQSALAVDGVVYLPLDHPWIVRRALNRFDPSILIFLETEIWPNLLRAAHRKGIPALLLSGRISRRAFYRYSLFRPFFSRVVRQFTVVGMQSEHDAQRMIGLGADAERIQITGSLKHSPGRDAASYGAEDVREGVRFESDEERQILVVGSTHRGEEEIILDVFLFLKVSFPALMMVLAPRHPERFDEVERLLRKSALRYQKKSQMNGRVESATDVLFLDTLGDLRAFYAVASVAFVGGSLVDAGGHNIIEPAQFRKPILFGPYMTNFADIAAKIKQRGGGIEVRGKEDLMREIALLLKDPKRCQIMGESAYRVAEEGRGVVERSMELINRCLSVP